MEPGSPALQADSLPHEPPGEHLDKRTPLVAHVVKNPPAIQRPGSERSPRGGHGKPLQYFCLENPYGQRSQAGYSPRGPKELDMTEQLSRHTVCVCQSQPPNLSLLPFPPHTPKTVFYICDSIFCK